MILQAWDTLPSCLASSSKPTLARITLRSLVMFGSSVLGYREEGLPSFRSRVARTKQTRMSDQILANTLYLDPPDRALVLCVDEKSQIQALDRTQPLLPMRPGQAERHTHDYKRHGTTSLFAALDVKGGTIIGKCQPRHRAQEFRRFLDTVEQNVPADLDIHVVMDNASSYKTKLIRDRFAKRSRWHVHFTPTSSSWINQVERFFVLLTERQIKRGAHRSAKELENAIAAYIDSHNADPKPFRWTSPPTTFWPHRTLLPPNRHPPSSLCIGTSKSGHLGRNSLRLSKPPR